MEINNNSAFNERDITLEVDVSKLEKALRLHERVKAIESSLDSSETKLPWWRDSKTVTILTTLLAAIVPFVAAINGYLLNTRESNRLIIEHQDKIREVYLDKVLKSNTNEKERQMILRLLKNFKSDAEMQQWASNELESTNEMVDSLKRRLAQINESNERIRKSFDSLNAMINNESAKSKANIGEMSSAIRLKYKQLESILNQQTSEAQAITKKIGDPVANIQNGFITSEINSSREIGFKQSGIEKQLNVQFQGEHNWGILLLIENEMHEAVAECQITASGAIEQYHTNDNGLVRVPFQSLRTRRPLFFTISKPGYESMHFRYALPEGLQRLTDRPL